jgi:epoxyqueuosine reductase
MSQATAAKWILQIVEGRGWAGRLVPVERRLELWRELSERFERGEFDEAFFQEHLASFAGLADPPPKGVRSTLLVAVPDRMVRIRFAWQGREIAVTIPPTYVNRPHRANGEVERVLREALGGTGHHVSPADVPKKLLATRSGLARYGRNNITYIEGMGSVYRLVSLYTSIPCAEDPWREPEMMVACKQCRACFENCPTGAITEERFLLHAEQCLTYWNEKPGDVPFPEWIDPACHDQLIGCMRCQAVCPQNAEHLAIEEADPRFTEEETAVLVGDAAIEKLPNEIVDKLRAHGLLEYVEVLPRNLGALLRRAGVEASDAHVGRTDRPP